MGVGVDLNAPRSWKRDLGTFKDPGYSWLISLPSTADQQGVKLTKWHSEFLNRRQIYLALFEGFFFEKPNQIRESDSGEWSPKYSHIGIFHGGVVWLVQTECISLVYISATVRVCAV